MKRLCVKIRKVLKEYIHNSPYYTSTKLSNYLLHTSRTIENLHIKSMFPVESKIEQYFPSLIETLFVSEKVDGKYCSGQIVYLNHKSNDYIFTGDWGKIVLNSDGSELQNLQAQTKINRFVDKFLNDIKYCKFTTILLNIQDVKGPRTNLLMISKDSEGIILSLYDPIGNNTSDLFLDLFAGSLQKKYSNQVVVKNRINISCTRGDQTGYCSLLWIHIIIKLQERLSNSERRLLFGNLAEVEKCLTKYYTKKGLDNIVLVFTSKLILYYIKSNLTGERRSIFKEEYRRRRSGWGFNIEG